MSRKQSNFDEFNLAPNATHRTTQGTIITTGLVAGVGMYLSWRSAPNLPPAARNPFLAIGVASLSAAAVARLTLFFSNSLGPVTVATLVGSICALAGGLAGATPRCVPERWSALPQEHLPSIR